jgi:uncharacterized protein YybS (DUF2232 family)
MKMIKLGVKMKNVNQLTKGAMLLAIYSVLLIITLYIPLLGTIINLFLPLPFMLFAVKNNLQSSVVFFVASVFISIILGSMLAVPLTFAYGMTGVIIGYLIRLQKNRWTILFGGSIVFLLNVIGTYIVSVVFLEKNFIKEFIDVFRESFQTSIEMMEKIGQAPNQQMIEQFETSIAMVETLIPSLFVMSSFMIVFIIMLVSMPVLKRFGVKLTDWKPLRELMLPKSLLWYYLVSTAASLIMNPEQGSYLYTALANLIYILQLCMLIQGVSLIFFFCHHKGYPKAVPVLIVVFSLLLPFLLYIIRILGIIDLGFNLRKRMEKNG